MSLPPPTPDPALVARLRADLGQAAYTVEAVEELLGPLASAALGREQALPAQRVTAEAGTPLATLVRLFTLGDAVDSDDAARALPTLGVAGAQGLGLVRAEGPGVVASCDLRPYADEDHGWWVASDLSELATGQPLREDHVLGIGGASTTLASWTPRPRVDRALDRGTGCGVQALHLGAHARHVTVTDISTRALAFARFNAALNGCEWQVVHGSMLDPLAGQRFQLIVSNPPFVITPRSAGVPLFEYRDAGGSGDEAVSGLVRSIGEHLEPGGIAQFLGNWEVLGGADWHERVRGWVTGTGLDAWVVQREVQDPAEYAETWARDGGHRPGTSAYEAMYDAWLRDFAARDVEALGFGVITLLRPLADDGPRFARVEEHAGPTAEALGPTVAATLAADVWLGAAGDADLLATRFETAAAVTEERFGRPGAPDPEVIRLRQGGGLQRTARVDTALAAIVGACDGELALGAIVAAVAELTAEDESALRARVLPAVRRLVADGFLTVGT
jgi:hypothetical protein